MLHLLSNLTQGVHGETNCIFSLQFDESIDIGNEANLLCFVRYIYDGGVHDKKNDPTNTMGEAIFDSLNDFNVKNNFDWTNCVGICTDGATAMTGKLRGPTDAVAPSATATHKSLKTVLDESVKIVYTINSQALKTRLFKALCEEMCSEQTKLIFHTEVCWLSRGKVLYRLFKLQDEVKLFLHHINDIYDRMHYSSGWKDWHTWQMFSAFLTL